MKTLQSILGDYNIVDFLLRCKIDFKFFCERVLGLEIRPFHLEWFYLAQNTNRLAVLAPTGFGKTTILGVAYPLWIALNYRNKQILIISKSLPQSTRVLELIRNEIEENELLNDLKPKDANLSWSKQVITTTTKCKILCRPYSINIKGEHVDYIIMDEAASYEKPQIYFDYIVPRCVAKNGKIILISTPETPTDLMGMIKDREIDYVFKTYPAIVKNKSIWPSRFPLDKLNKLRKELGNEYFEKNYMCNVKAESEDSLFSKKAILECFDYNIGFSRSCEGKVFIGCDFAISKGVTADYDAYVVVEKTDEGFYVIKHMEMHKGMLNPAKIRRIVQLKEEFNPTRIIIDETNIGGVIIDDLRAHALPVKPQGFHPKERKKLLNILQNIIDSKRLVIPRSKDDLNAIKMTNLLFDQLIGFKKVESKVTGNTNYVSTAQHDDLVMALAMAIKEAFYQKSTGVYVASA